MKFPQVSIIILNWNGWEDTLECLESVYHVNYPNYQIIVIDNGSEDDSLEKIRQYCAGNINVGSKYFSYNPKNKPLKLLEMQSDEFSEYNNEALILIKNEQNSGFSEGNNIGIRYATEKLNPEFILLLNNDTVVDTNFLTILIKKAEEKSDTGILGPSILEYNVPNRLTYIGGYVSPLGRVKNPYFHETLNNSIINNSIKSIELDYISGCCLLVKRKVIEDVGLLDDAFFLYYEDTDLCLSAKENGYDVFFIPEAKILHKVSAAMGGNSLTSLYYGNRNQYLLIKKHGTYKFLYYILYSLSKIILAIFYLFKGKIRNSKIVLKALYDALSGKFGERVL